MSRIKTHVKKGDEVEVIAGNHKGKRGTVLLVNAAKDQVDRRRRPPDQEGRPSPTEATPTAASSSIDGPIHISNVKKVG